MKKDQANDIGLVRDIEALLEKVRLSPWEGVKLRNLWAILTFLRGPDYAYLEDDDPTKLKRWTVARVRYIVCPTIHTYVIVRPLALTTGERVERDRLLRLPEQEHFQRHWFNAVVAIRELYGYDLIEEKALLDQEVDSI